MKTHQKKREAILKAIRNSTLNWISGLMKDELFTQLKSSDQKPIRDSNNLYSKDSEEYNS